MTKTATRNPRRTAAQWHGIVEAQLASGLSAPKFCREKQISYPSFMNWKKKLVDGLVKTEDKLATFIELSPDLDVATSAPALADTQAVAIELDLGAGIHLRISRAS